ncbi:BTB/POZ domain-containing protein At3g22104-like [Coffea arabica]|uniref:BTB/POZ domain-containing protein At3g22104-like n=1 Tax=Coffea arabica TaxID=13443 RepID=A0A6P6W1C0_COFAR|nr:BTB/POZ domain-containing protein At3g22104-like [Coffea arabica]
MGGLDREQKQLIKKLVNFRMKEALTSINPLVHITHSSRGSCIAVLYSLVHQLIEMCCDLEIDVNSQETFLVDKNFLACFSGRLRKLFRKLTDKNGSLKLIFHDFPGGPEGFELLAKFCYNGGKINITPSNIILLHSASTFMEMDTDIHGAPSLMSQTKEYFKKIHQFALPELLECLKQFQDLQQTMYSLDMLEELLDCLVERLSLYSLIIPYSSLTDSSCIQFSGDFSCQSKGNSSSQASTWWFEDLEFLKVDLFEKAVETMIAKKLDNYVVCAFLLHYQKVKITGALRAEKCRITETVINLLHLLDRSLISVRGLFDNLRFSLAFKVKRCSKKKLESLVGSLLDQAKLDDLFFPSTPCKCYAYDVDLILRLQEQFLIESREQFLVYRLKKVASLMDFYLVEVAPDPRLEPSKFVTLATALPEYARDSHDMIYEAVDIYLKVHKKLSEEEKIKICCVLNFDKLSARSLIHLVHNMEFPACAAVTASVSQHSKLREIPRKTGHLEVHEDLRSHHSSAKGTSEDEDQVVRMTKLEYQTIDNRFKTCTPTETFDREKQTRSTYMKKLSSIFPTNLDSILDRKLLH